MVFLCLKMGNLKHRLQLSDIDVTSILLAAACHDYDHETAGMKQLVQVINCTDMDIYDGLRSYAESDSDTTFCTYVSDDDKAAKGAGGGGGGTSARSHSDGSDAGGGGNSTAHDGSSVDDGV